MGCPYKIEPLAMFWSHANGWCPGFLRDFYSFATMFWRRGCKNPYGYRMVTVCCMYGYVRCMCVRTYVLENTRRILQSLYVTRAGPGDDRECAYGLLAPYDCLRALYGEKKMCMHNFQTRAAYGYTWSIPAEKTRTTPCGPHGMPYNHPRVTGILVRTVPVNYPGAPCDPGCLRHRKGQHSSNPWVIIRHTARARTEDFYGFCQPVDTPSTYA